MIVLHDKTDFDVDFWKLSSQTEPGKCPEKPLIAFTLPNESIWFFEITFNSRSYPTSIDEGTTL